MRLPALTVGQKQTEDARAFHEAIWTAFNQGGRHLLPMSAYLAGLEQERVVSTYKGFWARRGYTLRSHRTATGLELWLTPRAHRASEDAA